jgi:hypothetical protein
MRESQKARRRTVVAAFDAARNSLHQLEKRSPPDHGPPAGVLVNACSHRPKRCQGCSRAAAKAVTTFRRRALWDACVLLQPQVRADELDQGQVVKRGLLIACCHCTKALDPMNKQLNVVANAIQFAIEAPHAFARRIAVNHWLHTLRMYGCHDPIRVVPRVGDKRSTTSMSDQFLGHHRIVHLTGSQRDVERPPLRVDEGVELGRKTSSRTAQSIALDPPLPPEASWCARTTVPSMMEPTSSTSSCSSLNTRSQTPRSAQLANRL